MASNKIGIVFDSSTMFALSNGAKRSPDVSWMTKKKWEDVTPPKSRKFSRVVQDFVIELLSLMDTQTKMAVYIENGIRLGWLIDPAIGKVHVYNANGSVEIPENPETILGEDVFRGFELKVREIW